MIELTIPLETGAENAGAMKWIRNAELVDSGTQDSYQATLTQPLRLVQEGSFMSSVSQCQTQIKNTPGEGGQSPSFRRIILY